MIYTITNNNYAAQISEIGAELKSLKNDAGFEYIWEGDSNIWGGTAPVLFPIVGKLKNDRYTYKGKSYSMNQHGFVRKLKFEVLNHEESTISFKVSSNAETKLIYPFDFELIIEFEISEELLTISYFVQNLGKEHMYFTIGSHPAFALQTNNCELSDYYIEFEKKEMLDCYVITNGLLDNRTIPLYMNNENVIKLNNDIFNNDALVFKNIMSKYISIKNDITGYNLKVNTGGAPHLGIWAKPAAPYVCIEPWYGFADSVDSKGELTKKQGIIKLNTEESFVTEYQIII